jgi:hypothetical protein
MDHSMKRHESVSLLTNLFLLGVTVTVLAGMPAMTETTITATNWGWVEPNRSETDATAN